jgi:hypothetical protein
MYPAERGLVNRDCGPSTALLSPDRPRPAEFWYIQLRDVPDRFAQGACLTSVVSHRVVTSALRWEPESGSVPPS